MDMWAVVTQQFVFESVIGFLIGDARNRWDSAASPNILVSYKAACAASWWRDAWRLYVHTPNSRRRAADFEQWYKVHKSGDVEYFYSMAMVRHAQAVQDNFLAHCRLNGALSFVDIYSSKGWYPTDADESESESFEYPFEYTV